MANVNIKKESQRVLESNILLSIKGRGTPTAADREAAAVIAAKSMEAVEAMKKEGGKRA